MSEMGDLGSLDIANDNKPTLLHSSLNADAKESVLFIHGAFGDRNDWDLVVPYLTEYHLLLVDLPSHGASRHLQPFSLDHAALLLSNLVEKEAINGRAHVVGLSLGAHVAINLAVKYPNVVDYVLVSGYQKFDSIGPTWLAPYKPRLFCFEQRLENLVPSSIKRYLLDGTDLRPIDSAAITPSLCDQIMNSSKPGEWPSPWPARTLIIAATKGGIIPSLDYPEHAQKLATIGRQLNNDTMAVKHSSMRHPWNRQAPELFAATVRAWIQKNKINDGFKRL